MDTGSTFIITNPAAKNGAGAAAGRRIRDLFDRAQPKTCKTPSVAEALTEYPRHARELAANQGAAYKTVIAVGGDGVIHEIANGLMSIPATQRPTLGIVPVGSGNDYAKTLGMSQEVDRAFFQLQTFSPRPFDVGCANGEYFVETLSFGLDAAIALATVERRTRTSKTGRSLYFAAGIDQLLHHFTTYRANIVLDGKPALDIETITFAVQIGPTYGGGFRICPDARADDGLFDICYSLPASLPHAIAIFARARNGKHVHAKPIRFERAQTIRLLFEEQPAVQADGERLLGTRFDICMHRHALNVICNMRS